MTSAERVAELYFVMTGYRFHPTVIGHLYARAGLRPVKTISGEKMYQLLPIYNDLEALRKRRQSFEEAPA